VEGEVWGGFDDGGGILIIIETLSDIPSHGGGSGVDGGRYRPKKENM
jgi:hypothetical protein